MSVSAVELSTTGDDAARVLGFLAAAVPQVRVIAATRTRVVTMNAIYDGDDFVMAGGTVGADTITAMFGSASELPEELIAVVTALGQATSVPAVPRFVAGAVPVPDALVLAHHLRAGGIDDVLAALRTARLDQVPAWLHDLAHGVSATFLVIVSDEGRARLASHLIGLPSGWGHLQDVDDVLSMRPATPSEISTELHDICLRAASLVRFPP